MYVVFVETVSPQALLDTIQQTPNPAAQFPSDVPLLLLHSELVMHVP